MSSERCRTYSPLTLESFEADGQPECFHCGARFPIDARVKRTGKYVIVSCACGCLTPFKIQDVPVERAS
jgi:hypothetical protein